jgi:hypothetical protein
LCQSALLTLCRKFSIGTTTTLQKRTWTSHPPPRAIRKGLSQFVM